MEMRQQLVENKEQYHLPAIKLYNMYFDERAIFLKGSIIYM